MAEKIGTLIDELRLKAGYKTLGQLHKSSSVTVATLSRIISNKQSPSPETLKKLSKCLDVTHEYLLMKAGYISNEKSVQAEEKKPKDLQKILEDHEIMFDGIPLDDDEKQEILDIIQYKLYKRAKELNKRKK